MPLLADVQDNGYPSFNAPIHHLIPAPIPLAQFQSVQITFKAKWLVRYDQGGLIISLSRSKDRWQPTAEAPSPERWLKSGVEFYLGKPYLATVATYAYSDWSLSPLEQTAGADEVTLELRREGDELGSSLWIYQLRAGEAADGLQRVPLREVTWFFAEQDGWFVDIGTMAARPAAAFDVPSDASQNLTVHFSRPIIDPAIP